MSDKELTPSEYQEMVSSGGRASGPFNNKNYLRYGILTVAIVVLCGASFGLGVSYQKGKQTNQNISRTGTTNNDSQFPAQGGNGMGRGGFGNGQRPNIGQVSAVSSDSITIKDSQSGSSQTFNITSSTTVQNNGSSGSVSDIKTGDTVLITTDSSDTKTATQVMLNPSFGGGPGANGSFQNSPTPSSSASDDQSI